MPQPPKNAGSLVGQRLGKYELLALIALGGTAEIYLARIDGTAGFEKYVVVKCLHDHLADDEDFVRMFLDEARLGAQLDHSNIVQTLELGEHEGRYYMVMEYLAGMSLALVARRTAERVGGGRIPVHLVLGMAAQACAGLHYAHQRVVAGTALNIVHRDISPQNLVITFEGILKLVDFGIAKAELRETHTKSGTIKGKFAYMSPEQCMAKQVDRRTDIFALGVIMHELLTGRRLFKRQSTYDTYQAILECKVPPPSTVNHELDPGLDEVVMTALQYEKEKRYPDAEAFGEAIMRVLHSRGKAASAGDISRFFDEHFSKEIDEQIDRMRQLIEGRVQTIDEYQWDTPDPNSDVAEVMPDDVVEELQAHDIDPASIDPGEDEGEATRIELNPLGTVQDLHALAVEQAKEHMAAQSAQQPQAPHAVGAAPRGKGAQPAPGRHEIKTQLNKGTGRKSTMAYGAVDPKVAAAAIKSKPQMPSGLLPSKPQVPPGLLAPKGQQRPKQTDDEPMTAAEGPLARQAAKSGAAQHKPAPPPQQPAPAPQVPQQQAGTPPPGQAPIKHAAPEARTLFQAPAPKLPSAAEAEALLAQVEAASAPGAAPIPTAPEEEATVMPLAGVPRNLPPEPDKAPPPAPPVANQTPPPGAPGRPGTPPPAVAAPDERTQWQSPKPAVPSAAEAEALMAQVQGANTPPPQAAPQPPQSPAEMASAAAGAGGQFPPINTPTAFRERADMIPDSPLTGAPGSDMAQLAQERAGEESTAAPAWLLGVAFVGAAGIALGLVYLISKLA